jgi:hypothetical protein
MNIFKQTILVLVLSTQIAPVVLAGAAVPKPEVAQRKKVASKMSNRVLNIGAGVFGAAALASALVLGYQLRNCYGECKLIPAKACSGKVSLRHVKVREYKTPFILCPVLTAITGTLAYFSYRKASQVEKEKPVEKEKQK